MNVDPVHYGYRLDDEDQLQPIIVNGDVSLHDLPQPCKCVHCAKSNACICRINEINCCDTAIAKQIHVKIRWIYRIKVSVTS